MKNPEIQKVIKSATDINNNYEYEISVTKKVATHQIKTVLVVKLSLILATLTTVKNHLILKMQELQMWIL